MKILILALATFVSLPIFAASKEVISCHNKYETFTVTVNEDQLVVLERSNWERSLAITTTKKIGFSGDEVKVVKNEIEVSIDAREPSILKIVMSKVANNDNNILEIKISSDNASALDLINETLSITANNSLIFDLDECNYSAK
jgi:hypothetical protein